MLQIANNLSLPVELAGRRTAVFGISGSGKSNTATVLIEQLFNAGEQVVLIDPKEPTSREEISDATGFQRSTRDTYIQRLCARRLLRVVGSGKVIGSDDLFD